MRFRFLTLLFPLAFLISCSMERPDIGINQYYYDSQIMFLKGEFQGSTERLEKLIKEQTGTKYASAAYLTLADTALTELSFGSLEKAEVYYQLFLDTNPGSNFIPYVFSRRIYISYLKNENRLFVRNTDYKPFEQILEKYKQFYLFYPRSVYFEELKDVYQLSLNRIGRIEETIGDWYFKKRLYSSAVNRYKYILFKFPEYDQTKDVAQKLLDALKFNNQLELRKEYEESFKESGQL